MTTILLIDDDDGIRDVFARILRWEGYAVKVAENGNEALRIFSQTQPQLVITDIIMPDMEGLETITKLREKTNDARIIAISGGGFNPAEPYLKNAALLGADATLKKPCRVEKLISEVKRLIG